MVWDCFLYALQPKCVVSSSIESYYAVTYFNYTIGFCYDVCIFYYIMNQTHTYVICILQKFMSFILQTQD